MFNPTPPHIDHPLCVYVLFHQDSKVAEQLADYVFRWLRLHDDAGISGDNTGMGVPVYFRSVVRDGQVFPKIPWQGAHHNVVVVLSDDMMNVDPAWRRALEALHELCPEPDRETQAQPTAPTRRIIPVMLSLSLNAITYLVSGRNPLRVYDRNDPPGDPTERWGPRLRRGLTEWIVRVLYNDASGSPARLKIFISHSKDGGLAQAEAIRDRLPKISQTEAWFDSNDLTPGYEWAKRMEAAATLSTGGLIAVVEPAWPTRPWCRHEAAVARTPREVVAEGEAPGHSPVWKVQPAVVARVAKDRWYRLPTSVAQLPTLDCPEGEVTLDWLGNLFDRLLLEHLLAAIARRRAMNYAAFPTIDGTRWWYLTFVPDAFTLERLSEQTKALPAREGDEEPSRPTTPQTIIYPGHGLVPVERAELERTAAALVGREVSLVALEHVELDRSGRLRAKRSQGFALGDDLSSRRPSTLVGISAGGDSSDVRAAGVSELHINDLMLRLTRRLLGEGHRAAYGGTLSAASNLTTALITAARRWHNDRSFYIDLTDETRREEIARANAALATPPVVNYSAWPHNMTIDTEQRGRDLGTVGYETFDPPRTYRNLPFTDLTEADRNFLYGRLAGDALTAMRSRMAADCEVRVFFAGKIHFWAGWLPGIAEELVTAAEAGNRCVLIGGFGGLTHLLVEFLVDRSGKWPPALTWEQIRAAWDTRTPTVRDRWLSGTYESERENCIKKLQHDLTALRDRIHARKQPGIFLAELVHFATVSSATSVVNYIARVANNPDSDPTPWLRQEV